MKKIQILLALFLLLQAGVFAQGVGINATGANPDPSAVLDVSSTSRGLLVPRIALTITTSALPITAPATSLLVYNTATVTDVTPGYYYWNGTTWIRMGAGANTDNQDLTSTVTGSNATVNINGGTSTTFSVNDADFDPTNEYNTTFGVVGGNLALTDGGGTLTTPLSTINADDWHITGNAGTVAGTNFIGTTDAQDLVFKTNGVENMRVLNSNGNVGIGTTTPGAKLEVAGQVKITGGAPGVGKVLMSDAVGLATWASFFGAVWLDVTGSRALNTTYTNNTGKLLYVTVTLNHNGGAGSGSSAFYIDAVAVGNFVPQPAWNITVYTHIIPVGATYSIGTSGAIPLLLSWNQR